MAEADAGKVTVEEVNLEELMEVITSYKCRFCDFTSTTTNDMAAHLHTVHITTSTAIATTSKSLSTLTSRSAVTNTELQSMPVISHAEHASLDPQTLTASAVLTESVSESTILAEPVSESAILADAVSESSALAVSESDVLPEPEPESNVLPDQVSASTVFAEPQLPLSGDSHENGVVEAASHSSSTYAAPVFFSNLGLTSNKTSASHRSLVSPALPDPKVLTNQVRSVAKNLPIIPSSQSDLQLFSLNGNTAVRQSLPISSLQLTGSGLTLVSTALDSVPFVDHPKDLGTGPASIAPVTKELYLCGLCSMGFSSVEDCNGHMERDHQAQLQGASVSETVVNKFEQRTSVGTQATGKKPGRKRKSEMPPPSSPPPLRKGRDDTGHFVDDENDEDWIPGRTLSSGTRDGRQRRKIRAPKALKEDYVTEKKRTYRKRKLVAKESFPLECNYMGCPTKFLAPASLDIHHACHNKEDDAFTCIHCNQPFQFWKPLRIHLYRNHQVDCDMYQCDICQYKTDTLHKLGVHREIHSDNRPYTCDVCGKGFKQLSQMKNHQIIHAQHQRPGRESWFSNKTCEVCKRTFANSKCLKKHVEAVHGQNKPFQCQYCSHTTAWKAMLILHERTHTGEKPFKSEERCLQNLHPKVSDLNASLSPSPVHDPAPCTRKPRKKAKSGAERIKEHRARLLADPVATWIYRYRERLRCKLYRMALTEDKKKNYNEKARLRMQRYRQRKLEQTQLSSKPQTRENAAQEEQLRTERREAKKSEREKPQTKKTAAKEELLRTKRREAKRREREKMSPLKKMWINQKRREQRAVERALKEAIKKAETQSLVETQTDRFGESDQHIPAAKRRALHNCINKLQFTRKKEERKKRSACEHMTSEYSNAWCST